MAKTIEQMAVDYMHQRCGCCNIEDFEAGANAVLKEVEFVFEKTAIYRDGSDMTILYKELKYMIEDLKGE